MLLQRTIADPATDKSNEAKILNSHYQIAFDSTISDLDLDSTSTLATLALIETDPIDLWDFAYAYPSDCVQLRRVLSSAGGGMHHKDNRRTHIPKRVAMHGGSKVIFTNESTAILEYISNGITLSSLSVNVGLCVAYKLAMLSSTLITGKGAKGLRDQLTQMYIVYKTEAQESDRLENENYYDERVESDWVDERTS